MNQVVSSLKWLEDEAELASLYNTKAKFGSGHERKSSFQRGLFSAVVGGRLNGSSINNLSGTLDVCSPVTALSVGLGGRFTSFPCEENFVGLSSCVMFSRMIQICIMHHGSEHCSMQMPQASDDDLRVLILI